MTIPWEQIFAILLEMIQSCPEQDDSKLAKEIRNPGLVARIRFERKVRMELGCTISTWRECKDAVMAEIYDKATALSDLDISQLLTQARSL